MDDVGVTGLILTAVGIVVALGGITVATLLVTSGKTDRKIDTLRKDMGKARKNNEAAHAAIGKNIKRRTSRRRIQRIVRGVTKELTAPPPAKPGPEPGTGTGAAGAIKLRHYPRDGELVRDPASSVDSSAV